MKRYHLDKYNDFDRNIFEQALLGISYKEIAKNVNLPYNEIKAIIKSLDDPKSSNYNVLLFDTIKLEQSLNKKFIDYDRLEQIIEHIRHGYSFLEIAIMMNLESENEVVRFLGVLKKNSKDDYNRLMNIYHRNLEKKKFIIYERIRKLENTGVDFNAYNNSELYNDYLKYKKRKDIIYTFMNYNTNIEELAKTFTTDKRNIQEYLKNADGFVEMILPQKQVKIFYEKAKVVLEQYKEQNTLNALTKHNKAICNKRTDQDFTRVEINFDYYVKLILSFKLTLEEIARLINIEPTVELYNFFINNTDYIVKQAIKFNFNEPNRNPGDFSHYEKAQKFTRDYGIACLLKDQEKRKQCLDFLNDKAFFQVIRNHQSYMELSEEEKKVVFEFRIKYVLTYEKLQEITKYYIRSFYVPLELKNESKRVDDYNTSRFNKAFYLRRKMIRKESNNE